MRLVTSKIFILISAVLLCACSKSVVELAPSSEKEMIPRPKFVAKDPHREGAWPSYSQIRVFEVNEHCQVLNCELVWHVIVSGDHSPREIVYGGLPSFGAMTIVSAKDLERGKTYALRVDRAPSTPESGEGELLFFVNDHGRIERAGKANLPEISEFTWTEDKPETSSIEEEDVPRK